MPCACNHKHLCPDALDLWALVENAWDHLVKGGYHPAIIDIYQECWADYRAHRKEINVNSDNT